MDQRQKSKELFLRSGIINNAYNWHIWKRAFDLGVAHKDTEQLLNECLNDALCKPERIKGVPNSNKIAEFITKWIENYK